MIVIRFLQSNWSVIAGLFRTTARIAWHRDLFNNDGRYISSPITMAISDGLFLLGAIGREIRRHNDS